MYKKNYINSHYGCVHHRSLVRKQWSEINKTIDTTRKRTTYSLKTKRVASCLPPTLAGDGLL